MQNYYLNYNTEVTKTIFLILIIDISLNSTIYFARISTVRKTKKSNLPSAQFSRPKLNFRAKLYLTSNN